MELAKVPCWLNTGCWLNIVAAAESGAEQVPHVIKDKSMGSKIHLAKMFAKPTGGRAIAALATPAKSPAKRASATWQQRISRLFVCAGVRRKGGLSNFDQTFWFGVYSGGCFREGVTNLYQTLPNLDQTQSNR